MTDNLSTPSSTQKFFRRILITLAAGAIATLAAQPTYASDQAGTVTKVAFAGGRFLFWLSGTRTGTVPGCDCCRR